MGPTPRVTERSSSTLLPTIFPSSSATMQKRPALENSIDIKPTAWSTDGRSQGKLCSLLIFEKALKQICPQTALSSGLAGRRITSAECVGDIASFILLSLPEVYPPSMES